MGMEAVTDKTEEKAYKLRELKASDIFPTVKILGKIGINEFKSCFESDNIKNLVKQFTDKDEDKTEIDVSQIGMTVMFDVAGVVLSHIPDCENDIYTLLSGLSGMTKTEIAELPAVMFAEMIIDVVKMEGFKDFIKAASKLLK